MKRGFMAQLHGTPETEDKLIDGQQQILEKKAQELRALQEVQEKANEHVEKGKVVQVSPIGQQCIDGRTEQTDIINTNQQKDIVLRPGGAAGWSLILISLGYSVEVAYEAVAEYLHSIGMRYEWHTDNHSFGSGEDTVKGASNTHRGIVLDGQHNEEFILKIVKGNQQHSILPRIEASSAFVYDHQQDTQMLTTFVEWFNGQKEYSQGKQLDIDLVLARRDKHDLATLRLLAAGKRIFEVKFEEDGKYTLSDAGEVKAYSDLDKQTGQSPKETQLTGCGHLQRAVSYLGLYAVDQAKVVELYRLVQTKTKESMD